VVPTHIARVQQSIPAPRVLGCPAVRGLSPTTFRHHHAVVDDTGHPDDVADPAVPPGDGAGGNAVAGSGRQRVRYRIRRPTDPWILRLRRGGWALVVLGLAVIALVADVGLRARAIASHIDHARGDLTVLRRLAQESDPVLSGKRDLALASAQQETAAAQGQVNSPEWRLARHLPGLGGPVSTVSGLARAASDVATNVLPSLLQVGESLLDASTDNRRSALRNLDAQSPRIEQVLSDLSRETDDVRRLNGGLSLPALQRARASLLHQLEQVSAQISGLRAAAVLAPDMLGVHGDRTVLVVLQQPAESRATGGLVGGVVLLTAKDGKLSVSTVTGKLPNSNVEVIAPGPEYLNRYGRFDPLRLNYNSNLSPDFPTVAATWAGLWQTANPHVDEVVGVTPALLDKLLEATGPVTLPDGTMLRAGEIETLTTKGLYDRYPRPADEPARQAFQNSLLRAVVERLASAQVSLRALAHPLGLAVRDGDLRLWSARTDQETALLAMPLGGVIPSDPGPFLGVITQNYGGTKLDTYLQRTITYRRTPKGDQDAVRVDVALHSMAPRSGLPDYVTYRADLRDPQSRRGQNLLAVSVYLSTQASDATLLVDGVKTSAVVTDTERGHLILTTYLPLDAGAVRTVTVTATEPHSTQRPVVLHQATVLPDKISVG
jgi:hypothetical protein